MKPKSATYRALQKEAYSPFKFEFKFGDSIARIYGDAADEYLELPNVSEAEPDLLIEWCYKNFLRFSGSLYSSSKIVFWTDHIASYPLFYTFFPSGEPISSRKAVHLLPFINSSNLFCEILGERPLPPPGKTGFSNINTVLPGTILTFKKNDKRWMQEPTRNTFLFSKRSFISDMWEATKLLKEALITSIQKAANGLTETSITLSGGVDSSLVAALLSRYVPNVFSYTVGTPYGNEFEQAREVASLISSRHEEVMMTKADLIDLLPELIREMETWDPLTLQIAAPISFLYKTLSRKPRVFFTGYGADLLFAGVLDVHAQEAQLEAEIINQLALTNATNELSPVFASAYQANVRYPYFSPETLEAGLSIKASLKVYSKIEKYVLRKVAEEYLPHNIAWRRKVGIHEGTGMNRIFTEVLGETTLHGQSQILKQIAVEVLSPSDSQFVSQNSMEKLDYACVTNMDTK